jgi:hypothetical protein
MSHWCLATSFLYKAPSLGLFVIATQNGLRHLTIRIYIDDVICYKKGRAKELWRAQGREQELCLAK